MAGQGPALLRSADCGRGVVGEHSFAAGEAQRGAHRRQGARLAPLAASPAGEMGEERAHRQELDEALQIAAVGAQRVRRQVALLVQVLEEALDEPQHQAPAFAPPEAMPGGAAIPSAGSP